MADQLREVMEPGAAAERLGISPSGLRRLAVIYTSVHGELPREPKTRNRLWPLEAVERLERARALVEVERYRSIKEVLGALEHGLDVDIPEPPAESTQTPPHEALEVLIQEIRALREELSTSRRENAELQDRLEQVRRELPGETAPVEEARANHGLIVQLAVQLERWLRRWQ